MNGSDSLMSPSKHLIRDGRILSVLGALGLCVTAFVDALEIGAMIIRSAQAGLSNGGFAFLLNVRWLGIIDKPYPNFTPIQQFSIWQSILASLLLTSRLFPGLLILWSLTRLFRMYGHGEVFSNRTEHYVRVTAWALVGYAAVPLLTHMSLFMASMSPVLLKLEIRQLDALAAGLIVLAVARVVSFGCRIDEDRQGFV